VIFEVLSQRRIGQKRSLVEPFPLLLKRLLKRPEKSLNERTANGIFILRGTRALLSPPK
jgi:hypothetical protein